MSQDPATRIERKTRLALASGVALYVLSAVAIAYWGLPSLDAYYKLHSIDNVARALVFLTVLWFLLPLLPVGVYLFRYGVSVVRTGQHPSPGWRFIRPPWGPFSGHRIRAYGVAACLCGMAMFAGFVVVVGYFLYILFAR
jgi:hypothetical protein